MHPFPCNGETYTEEITQTSVNKFVSSSSRGRHELRSAKKEAGSTGGHELSGLLRHDHARHNNNLNKEKKIDRVRSIGVIIDLFEGVL